MGHGARPAERDRGRPVAQPRGRPAGTGDRGAVPVLPGLVPELERPSLMGSRGRGGSGGSIFSDSGIPDFGGMMSALGTIGNSPSSSGGGGGGGGFGGGRRAVVAAARAAASRRGRHVAERPNRSRQRVEALDRRRWAAAAIASPRPSSGTSASPARRPRGQAAEPVRLVAERPRHRRSRPRCRGMPPTRRPARRAHRRRTPGPRRASPCRSPGPGTRRPSHDPVCDGAVDRERLRRRSSGRRSAARPARPSS